MNTVRTILRRRRDNRDRRQRSVQNRTQRTASGVGFVLSIIMAILFLVSALLYADLTRNLPSIALLPELLNPPGGLLLQPTRVYDRTGQNLLVTFAPNESPRRYIPLDPQNPQHLPDSLATATIALIDPAFWDHSGYTLSGLQFPNLHATIAQQLVSDLLLWEEPPSFQRAIRERLLAAQITSSYSRTQVLEWYLNSAHFGNYAFGAEAAAQLYFGRSVTELSAAETAVLAATAQVPSLNPLDAPQAALQRGRETIHIMQALGFLSEEQADLILASPVSFSPPPQDPAREFAPAFLNLVLRQLDGQFERSRIERGGLIITTSMDFDLQKQASCAMLNYISRLQGETEDLTNCPAARLLPSLSEDLLAPQASLSTLILDPRSGQVLAVTGETVLGQETVTTTAHDSGSLLTPFIYLTGFTRGLSPASLVWDIPGLMEFQNPNAAYQGPVRLRLALANDYFVPALQVQDQMGLENIERTINSFGLDFDPGLRPLQDPISMTLLDVSSAYGVLAAQGVKYGQSIGEQLSPTSVLKVESVDHNIWLDWTSPAAQPVVTPQLAFLLNHILSDEPARWPSLGHPNPFEIGRPVAAKSGVTLNGSDVWAVGYTPYRVVTVWTGVRASNNPRLSPRLPAGLWYALMQTASRELPPDGWSAPAGITTLDVCDPSGGLPTPDCPTIVREVFANGSEPTQPDSLYRVYEINRETGYLATVFTPAELVDKRVYMAIPPEARSWAEANGFSTPPESYDAIQPVITNPDVYISSPGMFSDVKGQIEIIGTAAGENLEYYRVLVGQGLNPQSWVQVGEDSKSLVLDGTLADWDTHELDGLFAVQLQAVRTNQRVDTAAIQVTVDNTLPEINVTYPEQGQVLTYSTNRQVTFQAQAGDNLSLAQVEFFVDGKSIGALEQSPFALTWTATRGSHTLRLVARDRAGNQAEETIVFTME
jgi:membrane peptidoglycan carboxypeptidase